MEATANALSIARIIEPHVARVVLADPKAVKGMTGLRAKTDKSAWTVAHPGAMKCSAGRAGRGHRVDSGGS